MEKSASASLTRRGLVAMTAGAVAALTTSWIMGGCSTDENASGGQGDGVASSDTDSPSTQEPLFDPASFTVGDALGETYQQALEKAQEIAPDAMLFALRSSHAIRSGEAIVWDYMFASQKELRYYIAFTGDVVSVSEMGKCTMKFAEWENVPPADAVKVDAAAAFESICTAATAMAEPTDLYAYLILYSEEADTGAEAYSYIDEPMNWYFEFGFDTASADAADGGETTSGDSDSKDTIEAAAPPSADEEPAAMTVWSVNAETGETVCVVE